MSDQEQTEIRKKGLAKMSEVYGWEMSDGPGDYFAHTCDQVFGTVWTREGLTNRDRRLLLLGALAASGQDDVAEIQAGAALSNGELTPHQLEEISCSSATTSAGRWAPRCTSCSARSSRTSRNNRPRPPSDPGASCTRLTGPFETRRLASSRDALRDQDVSRNHPLDP